MVEPADSHLCCGSAGTYNLMQPEISAELKRRKVATLEARAPHVIAAGNIGCMMQIGSGTGVPVVHTVELLDWATGGPMPPRIGQIADIIRPGTAASPTPDGREWTCARSCNRGDCWPLVLLAGAGAAPIPG